MKYKIKSLKVKNDTEVENPQLFPNTTATICVRKWKERIEQDRKNDLIKRWHWIARKEIPDFFSPRNPSILSNRYFLYIFSTFWLSFLLHILLRYLQNQRFLWGLYQDLPERHEKSDYLPECLQEILKRFTKIFTNIFNQGLVRMHPK